LYTTSETSEMCEMSEMSQMSQTSYTLQWPVYISIMIRGRRVDTKMASG
jgi:hypothetical protein